MLGLVRWLVKNTSLKFTDTESNKNEFFSTPRIGLEPSDNCLSGTIRAPTSRDQHSHFSSFLPSSILSFPFRVCVCVCVCDNRPTSPLSFLQFYFVNYKYMLVPVAARSKASVCGRSIAEIVGSNPTWGMDVCLL